MHLPSIDRRVSMFFSSCRTKFSSRLASLMVTFSSADIALCLSGGIERRRHVFNSLAASTSNETDKADAAPKLKRHVSGK